MFKDETTELWRQPPRLFFKNVAIIKVSPQRMTLVAAWIRPISSGEQLVVASDSRLSFGARWDCCPKIFPLARNDSILAFCGDTAFAYPVLLQLVNAILNYEKALSRELDITDLRAHFIKVIDSMRSLVTDIPKGANGIDPTDFKLLFAGYSTRARTFKAWSLYYDKTVGKFSHRPLSFHTKRTNGTKPFLFIGDNISDAMKALYLKLQERKKLTSGKLDMEPLEVLVSMSESVDFDAIGGPPQVVKVYPHANVLPINVLWPRQEPKFIAHFGRPLLAYEGSKYACLDLNDLSLLPPVEAYGRLPANPLLNPVVPPIGVNCPGPVNTPKP